MAEITRKDVNHIAKLARLDLTEDEKETYQKSLTSILELSLIHI